jgi:hypothetical protein
MDMERIFGGNPWAVIFRLVVLSIVVGIALSALGLTPGELIRRLDFIVARLYELGFRWVEWLIGYFLIGAVIVVPIWLVARFLGRGGERKP